TEVMRHSLVSRLQYVKHKVHLCVVFVIACFTACHCAGTASCPLVTTTLTHHTGFPTTEMCSTVSGNAATC
ncbi:hypothetical protein ElyMa_004101800, partial [Elysia marginata]